MVVGGLGLGYTAVAALEDPRVESLKVIDYLEAVIDWHSTGLLLLGKILNDDPRCELLHADFFAMSKDKKKGFNKDSFNKKDLILLDIDHRPNHVLKQSNQRFYSKEGLLELKNHLNPNGVFALWSDGLPDDAFTEHLASIFSSAKAHIIEFDNPVNRATSKCSVYIALNN